MLARTANAVRRSLKEILDVERWVVDNWETTVFGFNFNDQENAEEDDENAHAKTAYNANLTYDLKNSLRA